MEKGRKRVKPGTGKMGDWKEGKKIGKLPSERKRKKPTNAVPRKRNMGGRMLKMWMEGGGTNIPQAQLE